MNTRNLIRWAGVSAMVAGIIFAGIQPLHPLDTLASVTTTHWVVIQSLKTAMCLFGLIGLTGLYARQANEAGWLGLAGYLLFGFFFARALPTGCWRWAGFCSRACLSGVSSITVIPRRWFFLASRFSRLRAASLPGVGMLRITRNCCTIVQKFDTSQ